MFRIGNSNSSGSLRIQCQYPSTACGLLLSRTQSIISTLPIIAELGHEYLPGSDFEALCIKTLPLNDVLQERFSTSLTPRQIASACGFLMVIAFMLIVYAIVDRIAEIKHKIVWQETASNGKEQQEKVGLNA